MEGRPKMMWGGGAMGVGWLLMVVTSLAFLLLLVVAIVALVRWTGAQGGQPASSAAPAPHTAQEILDARFARGEIDAEEYRARSTALRGP